MNPIRSLIVGLIHGYRYLVSPVLPSSCRYHPTCSRYALEAVSRYGALKGGWIALKRISRCQPWGGSGYDPVPGSGDDTAHSRLDDNYHPIS